MPPDIKSLNREELEAQFKSLGEPAYRVVMQPETITVLEIEDQNNLEVQRVMIDLYGMERYLKDSGAVTVDTDCDQYGRERILYAKPRKRGDPLMMVKVVNSTPEPDGVHKIYFLRVNHECRPLFINHETGETWHGDPQALTCHNAVASTFGKYGHEYNPILET